MRSYEEQLLIHLIEELQEIGQMATKIMRFGPDSYHPDDETKTTNVDLLSREIGNMLYIQSKLELLGYINNDEVNRGIYEKKQNMKKYN